MPEDTSAENSAIASCDFHLSNISENEEIIIDCILNLEGKTVTLPKGVTLAFGKGDIKNSTLKFSDIGKIDGRLLNASLTIEGAAKLIDPIFKFQKTQEQLNH